MKKYVKKKKKKKKNWKKLINLRTTKIRRQQIFEKMKRG